MAALCRFYNCPPSEFRAMKSWELEVFVELMEDASG